MSLSVVDPTSPPNDSLIVWQIAEEHMKESAQYLYDANGRPKHSNQKATFKSRLFKFPHQDVYFYFIHQIYFLYNCTYANNTILIRAYNFDDRIRVYATAWHENNNQRLDASEGNERIFKSAIESFLINISSKF